MFDWVLKTPLEFLEQMQPFLNYLFIEVLSPRGRLIKTSPLIGQYFNPDSQTALQKMLFDWACIQSNTVEQYEQH